MEAIGIYNLFLVIVCCCFLRYLVDIAKCPLLFPILYPSFFGLFVRSFGLVSEQQGLRNHYLQTSGQGRVYNSPIHHSTMPNC